jgi:hypothetical protein
MAPKRGGGAALSGERDTLMGVAGRHIAVRAARAFACALALASALLCVSGAPVSDNAAAFAQKGRLVSPGELVIAGRRLRCGATPTLIRDFEGLAQSSSLIVINLRELNALPKVVRWLVYYHECGHIHVGASETAADCWAVRQGRAEGWLTEKGLMEACEIFNRVGHGQAHPAPQERCDMLRQCFRGARGTASRAGARRLLAPADSAGR